MKYIIAILLFFISVSSSGQTFQAFQKDSTVFRPSNYPGAIVYIRGVIHGDTLQIALRDTTWHPLRAGTITTPDAATLYMWDGSKWNGISGGSVVTPVYSTPAIQDSIMYVDGGVMKYGTATGGGGSVNVYAPLIKSGDTISQRFNVLHYGADNTGTNDATPSIQAAINAAAAAGGGEVFFPIGTYRISGAYKTTDGNSHNVDTSQIYFPFSPYSNASPMVTIKLLGEVPPHNYANFGAAINKPTSGVILKSDIAGRGNIIGAAYATVAWGEFTFTEGYIENITVRARSKTSGGIDTAVVQTGVNAERITMFNMRNVRIDVESLDTLEQTPNALSFGLKTPAQNNFAKSNYDNLQISGFYTGMTVNEHTRGTDVMVTNSINAIHLYTGTHNAHFDILKCWWNKNAIYITGTGSLSIDQLSIEDYLGNGTGDFGSRFWNFQYDIYEPTQTLSRVIVANYQRGVSGVGEQNSEFVNNSLSNSIRVSYAGKFTPILPTANGTGTLQVLNATRSNAVSLGTFPSFPGTGAIYIGNVTPSNNNYAILSDSITQIFGAKTEFQWRLANSTSPTLATLNASSLTLGSSNIRSNAGYVTNNYQHLFTDLAFQNYSSGSYLMINNGYYNGGTFNRLNTGYAMGFHLVNGQIMMLVQNTGSGTFTGTFPFKADFNNSGTVVLGGNISNTAGTYTGGSMVVRGTGHVGIGQTNPTALLHFKAGTATANTAPLKFAAGTPLTTPESGVLETNTWNEPLYSTSTTTASRGFVQLNRYVAKTSTYTATADDYLIDCTSGTFTVTLPTAVGYAGRSYNIVNSGSGTITISTTSSQTFVNITSAPTTLTLAAVGAAAIVAYQVTSNGANWIVTGKVKNE